MTLQVPTPLGREAPPALVARLREIDPRTALVYMGDGRWWLGRVHPSDAPQYAKQHRQGVLTLDGYRANDPLRSVADKRRVGRQVAAALLKVQGFEWEKEFTVQGEPTGAIAEWWRAQRWLEEHDGEATYLAALQETSGETRRQQGLERVREYARAEAPSIHRHVFRRPIISHRR